MIALLVLPIAALAALFLFFREALPAIRARATGVIMTRGYRPQAVTRLDDPERFNKLVRQRLGLGIRGAAVSFGTGVLLTVVIMGKIAARGGY